MKRLSVLLVEDHPEIRTVLKEMIEREGHWVFTAADGQDALKKIGVVEFDLVIAEYLLPDTKGDDLARSIRRISGKLKIVILTWEALNVSRLPDVDWICQKPISRVALLQFLRGV